LSADIVPMVVGCHIAITTQPAPEFFLDGIMIPVPIPHCRLHLGHSSPGDGLGGIEEFFSTSSRSFLVSYSQSLQSAFFSGGTCYIRALYLAVFPCGVSRLLPHSN